MKHLFALSETMKTARYEITQNYKKFAKLKCVLTKKSTASARRKVEARFGKKSLPPPPFKCGATKPSTRAVTGKKSVLPHQQNIEQLNQNWLHSKEVYHATLTKVCLFFPASARFLFLKK
jgi:hypothetical protein